MLSTQHYSAKKPLIFSVSHSDTHDFLPDNWYDYENYSNFRAIKKQFRDNKPAMVMLNMADKDDESLGKKVTQFIRQGLSNIDTRIVVFKNPDFDLDEVSWLEQQQVNVCLTADKDQQAFNKTVLNRELDTFSYITNSQRQHDAETEMLMCITQFSRDGESLPNLLKNFSNTLSTLCYSACSFHLKIDNNVSCIVQYSDKELLKDIFSQAMGFPETPVFLQHAIDEKHPQINLMTEKEMLVDIEQATQTTIGSYLTFPIVVYGRVLYLLLYFIPEAHMDKVSMKQINVINKASEQLTILLERRQAETSLKKQYQRLKNALVEFKSTKQELVHKEKMASIGQMAAGIAHEINNPLSYVMSNFSSMDSYLENILRLQDLQSEFLTSIDIGQNQKAEHLRNNISELEEEADMPFIFEDIRSVVTDSYKGLQRVKNIITDLKSFTYSQSMTLELCNIEEVLNETVHVLKYDIGDNVKINTKIDAIPPFMAHNGLMGQVFTNLIKNAAQAMKEAQTISPTINIIAKQQGEQIIISVKDNGPGIPEELQKKVFDPFFTTKKVGEGTGLGLSVTFNIIKKLGGILNCYSEVDKFTEFSMEFTVKNK